MTTWIDLKGGQGQVRLVANDSGNTTCPRWFRLEFVGDGETVSMDRKTLAELRSQIDAALGPRYTMTEGPLP